jgi:hypothetical protein
MISRMLGGPDNGFQLFVMVAPAEGGDGVSPDRPLRPAHRVVNPFHAVGVKPGQTCCQAALAIKGQRFLSAEAPQLPLKACDTACSCVYVHFDDRRSGSDRRMRASGNRLNRRHNGGRRANDP